LLPSANRIIESTVAEVEACFTINGDSLQGAVTPSCFASLSGAANLQRIASLCGVADSKGVAEPQNPSITIEVPALPVKLRSNYIQLAVIFQSRSTFHRYDDSNLSE
jgi:hypothetical protein